MLIHLYIGSEEEGEMKMSVELIKKQVDLNEATKKECVQVVKERDMIVPDGKPDMQRVLHLDGKINIDQIDVQEDRIVYKGQINITILYIPENNPAVVYTMKGSIPLEDFIILEGVNKDQKIDFEYNIEHMHWNILNERKINVKVIIEVKVQATKPKEVAIVTDIKSANPVQTKKSQINIIKPSPTKEEKMIIKDELTIMQGKNSIGEILKLDAQIKEDQVKRTDNEILFNGIVEINTMYKAQGADDSIEVVTHRIPFSGNTDVPKADEEVDWNCELDVTPTYIQVAPDYDGEDRVIEVECIITAKYNTFDKITEQTIEDLYCPGKKIATSGSTQDYMTLKTKAHNTMPKKDVLVVDGMNSENNEIFTIAVKPMIEEQEIKNDKLTLKGLSEIKVIYTCKEGPNKIEIATTMVPFNQELDAPGIDKKSIVIPHVVAKDVKLLSQNKNDMVVEYMLDSTAEIYDKGQVPVLEQVELVDMDKEELNKYPSITVYVVKKCDNLWNIAKKFNTTVKDIVEINGLEENAVIHPGQKLIVLKKK